ncbi:serine/threonine protein kinase ppk15, putative [Entamoeba invadens IP1]|uniref:Serine/threonine protein kinase ppk15, putative n=1 Tax=Entamoeba invadens IP1 TaxID=370355 RepID=A0A0A1U5B8_ENTIV|nr:serine/threonine protein kinase ppk15, putative [Entamoeba invadens IP1]ELP86961.1 serine/threonine protein kinase ppk15, putative [Entamoeba invadens IP1]|eukprot:XP_004253732.1 serine/threonine protein kinase ppk15, putative [Entamoeba invadens IP1]
MSGCFVHCEHTLAPHQEYVPGLLKQLTVGYLDLIARCKHTQTEVLTPNSDPQKNYGLDNSENDLIIHVNDILGTATSLEGIQFSLDQKSITRYKVVQLLGRGTFGQVLKCIDLKDGKYVAIKVLKNRPAYFKQSLIELTVLHFLNKFYDNSPHSRVLKMHDYFMYYNHICIVTEMLGIDLYELTRRNHNHGFSIQTIRKFIQQILRALLVLAKGNIVHCDIKPENVLLVGQTSKVKLIDFGSACFENYTLYSYIQSRHYRAPEVVLGLPYSCAIDMWSIGCMTAELFLGYPLFGATSEYNLLYKMQEALGEIPTEMLERGTKTSKYFYNEEGVFLFKEQFEFEYENNVKIPQNRDYFKYTSLKDLILLNQVKISTNDARSSDEVRQCLLDFIQRCLSYNPSERLTPDQALTHPFITNLPFENYTPATRLYPFKEYGKTMTLDQKDFVQVMLEKMPELRYIHGAFNTQQYFTIFKTALNNGHVINILADSPLRGTITPPSLRLYFDRFVSSEMTDSTNKKLDPLPRVVPVKVQIERKERSKQFSFHLSGDLVSSLPSSPRSDSEIKTEKMIKKVEKERAKQLIKERKREEKEQKKEDKKKSLPSSKPESRDQSQERPDKKLSFSFFRRKKETPKLTEDSVVLATPQRAESVDNTNKKKVTFSLFKKKSKGSPHTSNSHEEIL